MVKNTTAPILSNESVIELLSILKSHNAPALQDFMGVIQQVTTMESLLKDAVTELSAMRRELAEAQKTNHPVKNALQKAVIAMQAQVLELRDKLAELKANVISGCKNAIAAFKDKGITALDGIARFFKIKPILESMRNSFDKNIASNDKAIAKIEAISAEYHEAGRHIGNMARAVIGKESVQDVKPPGKVAAAISYPFRVQRRRFMNMKKSVESAIGSVTRLKEKAQERKPPIKQTMADMDKKVARDRAERPAPTRARNVEHDI